MIIFLKIVKSNKKKDPLRWWLLGLLVLAMVFSYIDRGNIPMVIPLITDLFKLDAQQKGYIFSAFLLGYALMQIPSGRLVDRFGIKWTYTISFFLWSLIAAAFGFTSVFWHLLVLRLLLGVTESISGPAGNAYVAKHFGEEERGFASGLLLSGTKIGPAVGAVNASILIDSYGWRMLFILSGLLPLVWLFPWLVLYSKQKKRVENEKRNLLTVKEKTPIQEKITLKQLMQNRKTWGIFLGYFFYGYVWFLYISWLPSYLYEVLGFSIKETGWWAGFSYGCLALVVVLSGYSADKLISRGNSSTKVRKRFIVFGFLFGSLILPVPFISNPVYAMVLIAVAISAMGLATANTWAITQSVALPGTVGTLAGIQKIWGTFCGFIAPLGTRVFIEITQYLHRQLQML